MFLGQKGYQRRDLGLNFRMETNKCQNSQFKCMLLLLLNGVVSIYIIIVGAPDLLAAIPCERGFTFLQKWSFGLNKRIAHGFRSFVVVTLWAQFWLLVFVGRYRRSCVSTSPLLARMDIFEIDLCNLQHIRARRFHLLLFFCLEFSCLR